jgi:hypothetical protein
MSYRRSWAELDGKENKESREIKEREDGFSGTASRLSFLISTSTREYRSCSSTILIRQEGREERRKRGKI